MSRRTAPLHRRARRKLRRIARRPVDARLRRRGLAQLRATDDPTLRGLASALEAATGPGDADRRQAAGAIEQVRADMLASDRTLPVRAAELGGDPADERVYAETLRHACGRSKPPFWCVVLYELVRALRPSTVLELGTCVGVSAAYQAAALERNASGRLITLEAVRGHVEVAEENLRRLGLDRVEVELGLFDDLLPGVLATHAPVDLAFIDGNHVEEATLRYAAMLKPALAAGAVVIYDDISFSDEMSRAWETVAGDPDVVAAVDLGPVGLCVYGRGSSGPRRFSVPLEVKPGRLDRDWLRSA